MIITGQNMLIIGRPIKQIFFRNPLLKNFYVERNAEDKIGRMF
jgi:hypothetical protein